MLRDWGARGDCCGAAACPSVSSAHLGSTFCPSERTRLVVEARQTDRTVWMRETFYSHLYRGVCARNLVATRAAFQTAGTHGSVFPTSSVLLNPGKVRSRQTGKWFWHTHSLGFTETGTLPSGKKIDPLCFYIRLNRDFVYINAWILAIDNWTYIVRSSRLFRHGSEFSVQQAVMAAVVNKLIQAGWEGRGVCKFGSEEVEDQKGSGEGLYKLVPEST